MKKNYLDYDWTPVINFESGGQSYYNKFLKNVTWPGGASGLTVGIGADLGYMTLAEFRIYFGKYFTVADQTKLIAGIGLKGQTAKAKLNSVKKIELSWENAMQAFINWTLPKFWKLSTTLWPGLDQLEEKAQVALVSIVFNRGTSTKGDSRKEMRNIGPLVLKKEYSSIAAEIRSMKRLWEGKKMDGLIRRREQEALMVESVIK